MLYGCCSWVLTTNLEKELRSAQRKMLRSVLGKGRAKIAPAEDSSSNSGSIASSHSKGALEPWAEWIQRATHEAEEKCRAIGVPDWVTECRRGKWSRCGHVCRGWDGRWSHKIFKWMPSRGGRSQGHPFARWTDDLYKFAESLKYDFQMTSYDVWSIVAQERDVWWHLEQDFFEFLF